MYAIPSLGRDRIVFSGLPFLFYFLPFALLLYYVSPRFLRNFILLIVSLLFYAWGEPIYIVLLLFSAVLDYFHGLLIQKYRKPSPVKARLALLSSLIINIAVLTFFKYESFLIENINLVSNLNIQPLDLPLPIGISFYTFQTMSYSIDVYRGVVPAQRNLITFALYVSLFPQLIAGPIVRYENIERELMDRRWNSSQFSTGVQIFTIGLGKKVLLANTLGALWHETESMAPSELTVLAAWIGIIAFMFQIYFDFSGYSDMAVGLGKMFGFEFPKNFNYPYIAKSITEFWRRWHMTLSNWFRDHVYIPLGGNRVGKWKWYRNLFIVWGITGLWHGASWNFVLWGLYFGAILAFEKAIGLTLLKRLPVFFQHTYLLFIVLISWVLFVSEDLQFLTTYLKIMFGFSQLYDTTTLYNLYTNSLLFLIASIAATPLWQSINIKKLPNLARDGLKWVSLLGILVLSTAYLVDASFNPFLYFRF